MTWNESLLTVVLRPVVLAPLIVVGVIVGLTLPFLVQYSDYGREAINQRIDYEDSSLCEKFGFPAGTKQITDCKNDLADMRRRHERLLQY